MSALQDEMNAMVHLYGSVLADLDHLLRGVDSADLDLTDALTCRQILADASLGLVKDRLDALIGDALGTYESVVPGHGMVRRTRPKSRTEWKSEDLLRMVLDTRRVDETTGEIESDVEKIKHVYPLAGYQARRTALKERGIDPEDFCVVEPKPGWTIRVL